MNLTEFAERISPIPLTKFQKTFFAEYEKARADDKTVFVIFPRMQGRGMAYTIIKKWEKYQNENS